MKRTKRSRNVNIAIQTVFNSFKRVCNGNLERAQTKNDKTFIKFHLENIEQAGNTIRDELFGMRLVGAFTWREYLVLSEKAHRIETEYKNAIRNI